MDFAFNEEKNKKTREKALEIVKQLTIEEKINQTLHTAPAIERLGIRSYNWWNESLHGVARAGVATVFPQAIGLAATFDEDFIETIADAISTEGRAKFNIQQKYNDNGIYKGITFWAPNINIFRDPRWGRGHETFGEDPYLTSRLGIRYVKGIQGHDENYLKAAACIKHFAVHSGPEEERHSFNAVVSTQDLYETYLPAFEACVKEAKVEAVMGAYNCVNGSPCCGNEYLLKTVLREKWGFNGHVVSDCWAIKDFHNGHGVTNSALESAAMAMKNGCDLNCGNMFLYLLDAVKQGLVTEERIDEAVCNLLSTKIKLGLISNEKDNPYNSIPYSVVDSKDMKGLNVLASQKSLVLLKNENNLLPLDKSHLKTLGVIGPNANNRKALVGNYEGTASRYITVLEGIQEYAEEFLDIKYSEGCLLCKKRDSSKFYSEVHTICEESDVIVVCLGLDASLEGEEGDRGNEFGSGDKPNLNFPGFQEEVLKIACESGKPVILINLSGSAMDLTYASEHTQAIIQAWYPGALGGRAIARTLFGEFNPEGRLPVTFYKTAEELPDFRDYSMKGRTYRYMEQEALYPFGYGLSYTSFEYSNATVSSNVLGQEDIVIEVDVKNTGDVLGTECVQVYIKVNKENTPNAQLKAIRKVTLMPLETKRVSIKLPRKAFGLYDMEGILRITDGSYSIYVGGHQPDSRSERLMNQTCCRFDILSEK